MEILGIVWAASIICPASAAAKSTQLVCALHLPQHESLPIEPPLPGWRSRPDAPDWFTVSYLHLDAIADMTEAGAAAWQLGSFQPKRQLLPEEPPFRALLPAIGTALTSFEPAMPVPMVEVSSSAQPSANLFSTQWHSWSAIAAVRVGAEGTLPLINDQTQLVDNCLQASEATYQPSPIALKAAPKQQIWVHNHYIGAVSGQVAAQKIATKLRMLVQSGQLQPAKISPLVGQNFVGVSHQNDVLFLMDETFQPHPEVPAAVTAMQWVNNLRVALNEEPMPLAEVQMVIAGLAETTKTFYGTASWYGPAFHGRQTANGEIFNEQALTAAHKTLPFNTQLKVTNRLNGRSVVVRINDRGPYIGERSLDLSKAAAHCLGSTQKGVVPYEAVILEPMPKPELGELTTAQLRVE